MEDTRRRNEASMARKRLNNTKNANPAAANADASTDGTMSPASTGAMDSLLEKLRAAAPQARDQRDRRRRARLKDRHQIRVASGQAVPDLGDLTRGRGEGDDAEKKDLNSESTRDNGDGTAERVEEMPAISEGEDVAERAASLLQGLRGDGDGDSKPSSRDSSLRVRRRRESADDERRNRRRRRGAGSSSASGSGGGGGDGTDDRDITPLSPTLESEDIPEESTPVIETSVDPPPVTVISPPSPSDRTSEKPVELYP